MTKVLFIDNGVEFDSQVLRENPFGGAEVAFVSLVESLAKLGLKVTVYNNCINEGLINGVKWKRIGKELEYEDFDVLVVNRGDKYLNFRKECKQRIFWIHNPAKYLLKYRYLSKLFVHKFKIIFSSIYHLKSYPWWAPAKARIVIPYGIDDYLFQKKRTKNLNKDAIFTSNPMRGLEWLLTQWEERIFPNCKNAKLNVYSGFETYGSFGRKHSKKIKEILIKAKSLKNKGIVIHKPIERKKLFKKIESSRVFVYKGSDDETFCMAVAESQMLGVPAVVGNYGCLKERVINKKTGFVCEDDKDFCLSTINLLNNDNLWQKMNIESLKHKNYYNWSQIAKKWLKVLK